MAKFVHSENDLNTMLTKFNYTFEELNIIPEDFYELLGFDGNEPPEPFPANINDALNEAPMLCAIIGGYKIFNSVDINTHKQSIEIQGQVFLPSKTVTTQLKTSTKVALFVCTAGAKITERANKLASENEPLMAYIFDVLGSIVVEKAIGKIQAALLKEVQKDGLGISDRYSPGYCEWSVGEQQLLFSLLPKDFCGIKLSESSLMHPIKSVSGIIGIGEGLKEKGYQCEWCTDTNCIYGKIKRKK